MKFDAAALPTGETVPGSTSKLVGVAAPPIGWLVFNNPERRNAVSVDMWKAIPEVMRAFTDDDRIRVIILMGAGDKAFVSGADISEFEKTRSTAEDNAVFRKQSGAAGATIARSVKPTIAMIRGACIGGGLATALNCDLRVAEAGARFAIPAARLGIGYPFAGVARLAALVGPANAKALLYTARHFGATDARAMGLVNEVVDASALEQHVVALANEIAANAPLSIRAAKLAIDNAMRDPADRDLAAVDAAVASAMGSEDFREGSRAFLEKRRPDFRGA